jgi:hypothetical protein
MFLFILQIDSDLKTMVDNRSLTAAGAAAAARATEIENYETQTRLWNESEYVEECREARERAINNTPVYNTGNRVHHIRSIQVPDAHTWNQLFGREILPPTLRQYSQASIDYYQRNTNTNTRQPIAFAGQMNVSMIMMENYRPRVHIAIFIVYLVPHREFHDGHIIQTEFSEGSRTHQNINRMFDPNENAIVEQVTEYDILRFVADHDEMLDLLYSNFIDPDFNSLRFAHRDGGYVVDPNFQGQHQWNNDIVLRLHEEQREQANADIIIRIPPPPPVNNFEEIYRQNIIQYEDNADDNDILPVQT